MQIHALQTGRVQVKRAQIIGQGHGFMRRLGPLMDNAWSEWLPIYAFAVEHPDGNDEANAKATLFRLLMLAAERPIVFLPTDDPQTSGRLATRLTVSSFQDGAGEPALA